MNTKEYAEKEGITLDEAKELTGNTHWKQEVKDVVEDVVEKVEDVAETVLEEAEDVVETVVDVAEEANEILEDNPELLKAARALQTCIGFKTPAYLLFVLDHKDEIKAEYKMAKGLIERFQKQRW